MERESGREAVFSNTAQQAKCRSTFSQPLSASWLLASTASLDSYSGNVRPVVCFRRETRKRRLQNVRRVPQRKTKKRSIQEVTAGAAAR